MASGMMDARSYLSDRACAYRPLKMSIELCTQHSHKICQTYVLDYLGIETGFELEEDNVSDRHGAA